MKTLDKIDLSVSKCKTELADFKKLLDSKTALSERDDIFNETLALKVQIFG